MSSSLYMTHNGLKTVLAMRYELTAAAGDEVWLLPHMRDEPAVLAEYRLLGNDPNKGKVFGFVEKVTQ